MNERNVISPVRERLKSGRVDGQMFRPGGFRTLIAVKSPKR